MRLSSRCDKAISVSLNRESVRTPEINMAVPDRSDAPQGVDGIPWRRALTFTLNCALQALVVPGHHAVGEKCQSAGCGEGAVRQSRRPQPRRCVSFPAF
jgi:hypothetical protein